MEDCNTGEGLYKAAKGLIRVNVRVETGKIREVVISGDFFMYPEDELWEMEKLLIGSKADRITILSSIRLFYDKTKVLTPGVTPEDFTEAIMRGVEGAPLVP
ncbi:MAG: lipoate---protein ligase [Thermoproteota archaeon]|nr:lipoate---protein ligase [Thermoproteota archaeon]